jgi:hypothetical protein
VGLIDRWYTNDRIGGLRRFAAAITFLNVIGHLWLGFEQAWITPFVAVGAASLTEIGLELIDAWSSSRPVRFLPKAWGGRGENPVDFLLSAHISGLAVSMLLYANERLAPVAFAAFVAIASKAVFRVKLGERSRHWLNPSNFGIALTLLLFPWVGIAPPYMFTKNLGPVGDVALPAIVIVLGTLLNVRYTKRLVLILAWVLGFALQGVLRSVFLDQPLFATWMPMGGMAYLLFTFYMVTDPATTPASVPGQIAFGLGTAAVYAALMIGNVVFGLFFALVIVCIVRGLALRFAPFLWPATAGTTLPPRERVVQSDGALSGMPGLTVQARSNAEV